MNKKIIFLQLCLIYVKIVLNQHIAKGPLIWSDEFNNKVVPDPLKWNVLVKGNNYNNELQYYTNSTSNVNVSNGFLVITAKNEKYLNRNYTSGRIESKKKFTYGVFEMRAKLPRQGRGVWPAYWLFAYDLPWPKQYGEIDIMENVGWRPNRIDGVTWSTLNGSLNLTNNLINNLVKNTNSIQLNNTDDSFHIYTLDWNENRIILYADGIEFIRFNRIGNEQTWIFDKQFTLIVNNAVGGDYGAVMGIDNSIFPVYFVIDYVRQYQSLGDLTSIQWNGNNWAMNCEFNNNWNGNHIASHKTSGSKCGGLCANTKNCTHFVQNSYNGGTCWLKSGYVTLGNAILSSDPTYMCGIITSSSSSLPPPQINNTVNWNGNNWAMKCDFNNNNASNSILGNVLSTGANCGGLCYNTRGCTHFAWSSFNGGTCFMKRGQTTQNNAVLISNPNSVCGVLLK